MAHNWLIVYKMKLKILVFVFIFCALELNAQEPYFCTKVGTVLEYTRRYTDGEIKWYHKMKILEVTNDSGTGEIVCTAEIKDIKGKSKMRGPVEVVAMLTDGSVGVNPGSVMANAIQGLVGGMFKVTSSGDYTILPLHMKVGDRLPDAFCSVKAMGMTMKISVTKRKVISEEMLTTPVGTFDCVVVQEHKVEKGMTRNRVTTAKTWYSRDMGMIRHDTYDQDGKLETIEELTSIK